MGSNLALSLLTHVSRLGSWVCGGVCVCVCVCENVCVGVVRNTDLPSGVVAVVSIVVVVGKLR